MPRHSMPYLTLAIVALLSLAAIFVSLGVIVPVRVVNTTTPHPSHPGNPYGAPAYGFGGYSVASLATEIGAQWRVPTINSQSSEGNASTWIAVQNENRQFIQLGTFENKTNGVAQYSIFWSDVTENFHPQQLLEVKAGDLIRFKMVQTARGWRLSFDDVTEKTPETITVPYARGAAFISAQWIQEDPTIGGLANHLPYPSIAPTTFSHLTLNKLAPELTQGDAQVLSTADGVYLIPTTPRHDHFTFRNATGPAHQYLQDVFAYNAALYPFQADLFYNRSPSRVVLRQIQLALAALKTDLETQTWPKRLTKAVKGDTRLVTAYAKIYRHFTVAPAPISQSERDQLSAADNEDFGYADTLRHELGLPPIN